MKTIIFSLIITGLLASASLIEVNAQSSLYEVGETLFSDDFEGDLSNWSWEMETPAASAIQIIDGQLDFSSFEGGTTVWFVPKLEGSVMIEYYASGMPIGDVADSVSDINSFWMLKDLNHPDDILADSAARGGSFTNYHKLPGYYVGLGAGRNVRTTFKKHDMSGSGIRLDWGLLTDEYYLITPSFPHKIQLVYAEWPNSSLIQYICDDSVYFEKWDIDPSTSGWFAFRGWNTNVRYDNFKVYRLIPDLTISGKDEISLPRRNNLVNIFPNPFSTNTNIEFELENEANINLSVYNVGGSLVANLLDQKFEKGSHSYSWNASDLPSGVYIINLNDTDKVSTHRCQLIK